MKKMFVSLKKNVFAFSVVLLLGLVSCSRNKGSEIKTGIANPVKSSTEKEIYSLIGNKFDVPDESEDVSFSIIKSSLAQLDFSWRSCDCNARMTFVSEFNDVSGLYYSWENVSSEKICGYEAVVKYTTKQDGDILSLVLVYDEAHSLMYSFSITVPGLGPGDISDVKGLCIKLFSKVFSSCL